MILHFVKTGWRHISKAPVITFIQVSGLIIGLTVFMLISLWVSNQLSFDKFGKNDDRIYRVELYSPQYSGWTEMPLAMGPALKERVPEIENYSRIRFLRDGKFLFDHSGGKEFQQEVEFKGLIFSDSTFFTVFPFQFILGNPVTALKNPYSLVLEESMAHKIFGNQNPVGEQLFMSQKIFTITGVISDVNNFHIPFDAVGSIYYLREHYAEEREKGTGIVGWDDWSPRWYPTYVLLSPNADFHLAGQKMTAALRKIYYDFNPEYESKEELKLRPVKEIFLHGETKNEYPYVIHGNIRLIAGFSFTALLILFLAAVNFINLNTTRTFMRTQEIAIRKINGSMRRNIFIQFTAELIAICLLSFIVTVALVRVLLPWYNQLIGTQLAFNDFLSSYNLIIILVCLLLLILSTGVLPAWILSSFRPISLLRNFELKNPRKQIQTHRILLALQFGITIVVLSVTILVHKQIQFMKKTDSGFNMENVLLYGYNYNQNKNQMTVFKDRLLECPEIENVTYGHSVPSFNIEPSNIPFSFEGKNIQTRLMMIVPGYLDFFKIPVVSGRDFIPGRLSDQFYTRGIQKVLLNETAVKAFGLEQPVGKIGKAGGAQVQVIGVVKDFYCNSSRNPVPPLVFVDNPMSWHFMVKSKPERLTETRNYVSRISKEVLGKEPFLNAKFLKDIYNQHYKSDEKIGRLFIWFSLLSMVIAALGLFGISANAIQRRTKEIGIRKSNGATAWNILLQILLYFGKIILWSGIIAIPISWYLSTRWIKSYPYKTEIRWWIFGGSLVFAIFIALLTIIWKTWKASAGNPVNALRYE